MEPSNFSTLMNGRINLSAASTIKLLQLLNCSTQELESKLQHKHVGIEHFQSSSGKPLTLDSGGSWIAGDPTSGSDPADGGSIDDVPTARDLPGADWEPDTWQFLKQQQEIYRSAIAEIQKYLDKAQRARPNPNGSTETPRKISDNSTSKTPGSRPDLFKVDPAEHLKFLQEQRQNAAEELQLQTAIQLERDQWLGSTKLTGRINRQAPKRFAGWPIAKHAIRPRRKRR